MKFSPTFVVFALAASTVAFGQSPGAKVVEATMEKAATFYLDKVTQHGGYVYYTAPDLSWRHGEGLADPSQIWVQPPGTPTVGMAYLKAFRATGDEFYLKAAVSAGEALVYGQLESGAWTNSICFDPTSELTGQYRNGKGRGKNFSTLDDDISQSAIQFLAMLDEATEFKNKAIHESVTIALNSLLAAQFPNGAFPQGWDETLAKPDTPENTKGNFPKYDWRTEGRIKEYWDQYTLNDDLAVTVTETLLTAHRVYKDGRFLKTLKRLGDFLVLAQMPEPQPGWAQQYNEKMQPIWARKFEPAAISGRETEGVVVALMKIAVATKDQKYLSPIKPALAWLRRSELSDGQLARYYELETNKPLYMMRSGKTYSLTHDDANLPSHYGWKNESQVEHLEAALKSIFDRKPLPNPMVPPPESAPTIAEIVSGLSSEGAWISTFSGEPLPGQPKFQAGDQYIDSAVFSRNLELLAESLGARK